MLDSWHHLTTDPLPGGEPIAGLHDPGAGNGLEDMARSLAALETVLNAIGERVGRLETDVRNLQGQQANRS